MPSTMDQMVEAGARAFLKEYGDPTAEWFDYRVDIEAALRAALPILGEELDARLWHGKLGLELRDPAGVVRDCLSEIMEGK
jgi:hypothetical protein